MLILKIYTIHDHLRGFKDMADAIGHKSGYTAQVGCEGITGPVATRCKWNGSSYLRAN